MPRYPAVTVVAVHYRMLAGEHRRHDGRILRRAGAHYHNVDALRKLYRLLGGKYNAAERRGQSRRIAAGEYRGGLYIAASCRRLFNAASEIAVAVDTDSYHTDFLPFII